MHPGVNLLPGANLHPVANCAYERGFRGVRTMSLSQQFLIFRNWMLYFQFKVLM